MYQNAKVHPDTISIVTMTVNSAELVMHHDAVDKSREAIARATQQALPEALRMARDSLNGLDLKPWSPSSWLTRSSAFALNPTKAELLSAAMEMPVDNSASSALVVLGGITELGDDGSTFNYWLKGPDGVSKEVLSVSDIANLMRIMSEKQHGNIILLLNGCATLPALEKVMEVCPSCCVGIGSTTKVSQDRASYLLMVIYTS